MNWLLVAAVFAGSPEAPVTPVLTTEAVREVGPTLQTGSLIFSKGDCLAIKVFSQSPYTHVAAVVVRNGSPVVYDATSGAGVRCQPLDKYLASQGTADLYVLQPRESFSKERQSEFEGHLDSQLGRAYSIHHHLTGKRAGGVHCAEYATDALIASRVVTANEPPRVSPASLREGLLRGELYEHTATIRLVEPPVPQATSWCSRMWASTVGCTVRCWLKVRGCVLCY